MAQSRRSLIILKENLPAPQDYMFRNEVTAIGLLGKDYYWRGTVTDSAPRILIDIKSIFPHSSVYNLKVPHLFDEIDEVVRKMFGINI